MLRPERRFYIRAAKDFNCRSVREFLENNNSQDITEIMAFYMLEPFGQEWLQAAEICKTIEQVMTGKKSSHESHLPIKPPVAEQTPDQMAAIFRAMAREHNKKHGHNRKS